MKTWIMLGIAGALIVAAYWWTPAAFVALLILAYIPEARHGKR